MSTDVSVLDAAEKLGEVDRQLQVLAQGTLEAERRYREEPTEAHLRAWEASRERLRQARETQRPRPEPAQDPGAVFSTLAQACAYLRRQGYRVAKSKLQSDTKRGLVARTAEGAYTQFALDKYGGAHCAALTGVDEDESDDHWARRKRKAEALNAEEQARRRAMENERLAGQLIERRVVERVDAAKAQQLRSDAESWVEEASVRLLEDFGLGADALVELRRRMRAAIKEWLDRYAEPREYVTELPWGAPEGPEG